MLRQVVTVSLVLTCSTLFFLPPDIAAAVGDTSHFCGNQPPISCFDDNPNYSQIPSSTTPRLDSLEIDVQTLAIDYSSMTSNLFKALAEVEKAGRLAGLPVEREKLIHQSDRWDPTEQEITETIWLARSVGLDLTPQQIRVASFGIHKDSSKLAKTREAVTAAFVITVFGVSAGLSLTSYLFRVAIGEQEFSCEGFITSILVGGIVGVVVLLVALSGGTIAAGGVVAHILGATGPLFLAVDQMTAGEASAFLAEAIHFDDARFLFCLNITNPFWVFSDEREELIDELATRFWGTWGPEIIDFITGTDDPDMGITTHAVGSYRSGTTNLREVFEPNEQIDWLTEFVADTEGLVTCDLWAQNQGNNFQIATASRYVGGSDLGTALTCEGTISAQDLLDLNPGSDPLFELNAVLSLGSDTFHLPTDHRPVIQIVELSVTNIVPTMQSDWTINIDFFEINGRYSDANGDLPDTATLFVGTNEIDLIPLMTGIPEQGMDFSYSDNLPVGYHQVSLEYSDGVSPVQSLGPWSVRSSSSTPEVTMVMSSFDTDVGVPVTIDLSVIDSGGSIPGREIQLSTSSRGGFLSSANQAVFRIVSNGSGSASIEYYPGIPGSHVIVVMDTQSNEFEYRTLNVTGGSPSDWTLEVTCTVTNTTPTEAEYDCAAIPRYQGEILDIGTDVYFEANHGYFQYDYRQINGVGIAWDRYFLTKIEADSGDEIFTFSIPEHNVEFTHVTNLRVGDPPSFQAYKTEYVTSNADSRGIAVSEDGGFLVKAGGSSGSFDLYLYDLPDLNEVFRLTEPVDNEQFECLDFSPDSTMFVAGTSRGTVARIDIATRQMISEVDVTPDRFEILDIDWAHPDYIVAVTEDDSGYAPRVAIISGNSGNWLRTVYLPGVFEGSEIYKVGCSSGIDWCVVSSDRDTHKWFLIDLSSGSILNQGTHPTDDEILAVALNHEGNRMLVAGEDQNGYTNWAKLYSVDSSGNITELDHLALSANDGDFYTARFFENDSADRLIVSGYDALEIFDADGGEVLQSTSPPSTDEDSYRLTWIPSSKTMVATDNAHQVFYNLSGDDFGPTLSVPEPPSLPYLQTTVVIGGTAQDESGILSVEYRVQGGAWIDLYLTSGGYFEFELTDLPTGDSTCEIRGIDTYQNQTIRALTITRQDDLEAPLINTVIATPSSGTPDTQFTISCQVIDLGAGVGMVSARVHAGSMDFASFDLTHQGGDTFGANLESTGMPFGIFTIDVTAIDSSTHENSRTSTNAAGFEVVFDGLFGDGFDLGNTSRWSIVVGEAPPPPPVGITESDVIRWYDFANGSGSTLLDSSNNAVDLAINNAVWTSSEIPPGRTFSLDFDGDGDYCEGPSTRDDVAGISNFTVFGWFLVEGPARMAVSDRVDGSGDVLWNVYYDGNPASDSMRWALTTDAGGFNVRGGLYPMALHTWHFLVMTYDGQVLELHVDGQLSQSTDTGTPSQVISSTASTFLYIGRNNSAAPTQDWQGNTAQVGIVSAVLSPQEITNLYNNGNGISYSEFFGGP